MTITLSALDPPDLTPINLDTGSARQREREITIITLYQHYLHLLSLMSDQAGKYHLLSLSLSLSLSPQHDSVKSGQVVGWRPLRWANSLNCLPSLPLCISGKLLSAKSWALSVLQLPCVLLLLVCAVWLVSIRGLRLGRYSYAPSLQDMSAAAYLQQQISQPVKNWNNNVNSFQNVFFKNPIMEKKRQLQKLPLDGIKKEIS